MAEEQEIWVYDPQHLWSGLNFDDACWGLGNPDLLRKKAQTQFGRDFDSPWLATNNGLENPILIYVDDVLRTFVPSIRFLPHGQQFTDKMAYYMHVRRIRGDEPLPEELKGRGFEIWAMNRYPTPEDRLWYRKDAGSVLFDSEAGPDSLVEPVREVYEGLIEYYPDMERQRPVILGLYTRNGEFRIITRPHRAGKRVEQHKLTIATTLERQLYEMPAKA